MNYRELFDLYRKQLEHEDTLISHRITYGTVLQAALITAWVFSGDKFPQDPNKVPFVRQWFAWIGLAFLAYAFFGVLAATLAHRKLAGRLQLGLSAWKDAASADEKPLLPEGPHGGGSRKIHTLGSIFGPWSIAIMALQWIALLHF